MRFERPFAFSLKAPPGQAQALLTAPERVFADLPGLRNLAREGFLITGRLCGEALLFGEVCFPFRSRLETGDRVRLVPLPLAEAFWAELAGEGEVRGDTLVYQGTLTLHAHLPEGEKWGGRAFRRMVEAALERTLRRALETLPSALEGQ